MKHLETARRRGPRRAAWLPALLLLFPVCARAGGTLLLPKLEKSAQALALGDGAAYLGGLNALGVNPAGLHTAQLELMSHYQQLALATSLMGAGAALPVRPAGATVALSYLNLRSSGFERRDAQGQAAGEFATQDQLASVGVSRPFGLGGGGALQLGAGVKWLSSQVESYAGQGLGIDLGARYAAPGGRLSLGAALLNLGRGPALISEEAKLPTSWSLSGAWRAGGGLTGVGGVRAQQGEGGVEISVGVEYGLGSALALRGRYALAGGALGAGGLSGAAGGFGLKVGKGLGVDYAFQPLAAELREAGAVGLHRLTVSLRFAGSPERGQEWNSLQGPTRRPAGRLLESHGNAVIIK